MRERPFDEQGVAPPRTRRGLVLGAGGVLGAAWSIGALRAIEDVEGWDPRTADLFLGTSAGAVIAALLAAGIGTNTLVNNQRGLLAPGDPKVAFDQDAAAGGPLPSLPRLRPGSRTLLRRSIGSIHRNPFPALYASLPEGRGSLDMLGDLVDTAYPDGGWPSASLWISTMDYDSGERTVFGAPESPEATVREAVVASCSVPFWFPPVNVSGRRYVDGGVHSAASLDLLADQGLDEVITLAPMAAFRYDRPRSPVRWAERGWRRFVSRRVVREARKVRRHGTSVTLLAPGPEDLRAIGANLMDPSRRTEVLETSLRTSGETLRRAALTRLPPVGHPA